jgi:hypothetical protein
MAMHPTAVRFSDQMWRLIQTQAAEEGVSSSQFIREAVLARLLLAEMERDGGRDWRRALGIARRLLEED